MKRFLDVAVEAAREAGAMLRVEFGRPKEIFYKGEVDIVTESDKRSEALIAMRLRKEFPDHAIVAEEGSAGAAAGAKYTWHVDPLDGTTNFAHGYPCFGVSIGLLEEGEPIVAAIMNPIVTSCSRRCAVKAPASTASQSMFHHLRSSPKAWCAPAFLRSTGAAAPT